MKHKIQLDEVIITILRVLLTPIFVWYRIYRWVWDGSMFK